MGILDNVFVSIPGISWKKAEVGDFVVGVILPQWDAQANEIVTREVAQTDYTTKEKKTFADGTIRMQDIFLIQTDFRKFEMTSSEYQKMAREEGLEDDGLRTVVIKGYSAKPCRTAAALFKRRNRCLPTPGCKVEFELFSDTVGADEKGKMIKTYFAVGDDVSLAVANEYRELNRPAVPVAQAPEPAPVVDDFIGAEDDDLPDF